MSTPMPPVMPSGYGYSTNPKATIEGLISEALNVPRREVYPDKGTKPSHVWVDNGSGGQVLMPYYDAITSGKLEPGPTAQPLTPIEAEKQAMRRFMQTMQQPVPPMPQQGVQITPDLFPGYQGNGVFPQMPQPMPQIIPMARPQITPMPMQRPAVAPNVQQMSSRFPQSILSKLMSSVPVRRR